MTRISFCVALTFIAFTAFQAHADDLDKEFFCSSVLRDFSALFAYTDTEKAEAYKEASNDLRRHAEKLSRARGNPDLTQSQSQALRDGSAVFAVERIGNLSNAESKGRLREAANQAIDCIKFAISVFQ